MIICDLCGETKNCSSKEIDGKEYDICFDCWERLAERLKGKGRSKNRETIFLPPPRQVKEHEGEEPKPHPGEPPKIWGTTNRTH
jgi:ribosome-binding protein aMBF1 (putative translation factor)